MYTKSLPTNFIGNKTSQPTHAIEISLHIFVCLYPTYLCVFVHIIYVHWGRYYNCLSLPSVYTVHRAHLSQPSSIVLPNTHKRCLDLLVRHFAGHRRHGVSWIEYIWRVGVRCLLPWYKLQTARC